MGFVASEHSVVVLLLTLLPVASLLLSSAVATPADRPVPGNEWNPRFNHRHRSWGGGPRNHPIGANNTNNTRPPKKFVVGGSDGWRYGFNYTEWALNNGPFYINDTLVFKYDPPNSTTFPHSVYLLQNYWSFRGCDLRRGKQVATVAEGGGGQGFEFVLKNWWPHYFACGEHNGVHCKDGMMKFSVLPLFRPPCHA